MKANEIRTRFLEYFRGKDHEVVASSSLVPANDPSLLFTNAGMVQFKEVFLGQERRSCPRAVTAQRCVRAGGKHNDLENVGHTARHHTFFEMLGNFSFGDYFKRQAIEYAWAFLTRELAIPQERLWVTVYQDDREAEAIWLQEMRVDAQRFSRCGEQDNFWSMGETGPCGPCSEIFYDHGAQTPGGPPGSAEQAGERFTEIWNLVFMQYNRDEQGQLQDLPRPSVDTGMGLERVAAVLQGVQSNYDTDLFVPLIDATRALAQTETTDPVAARVIADHIRSCALLVADGVRPGNEGRDYVLRRIIRRAVRHGVKLGLDEPFFYRLVEPLEAIMGAACPELSQGKAVVAETIKQEEERFAETLEQGLRHLEAGLDSLTDATLPGELVFRLYDTYGFPVDLTADIARERQLALDLAGFERCMQEQKQRARAAHKFAAGAVGVAGLDAHTTCFKGYDTLQAQGQICALLQDGNMVDCLQQGQAGGVALDQTSFYAEAGGQAGDRGELVAPNGVFTVTDTQRQGDAYVHLGRVSAGTLERGQALTARVDPAARRDTMRNHSATHLLHAALREVLGDHVTQQGSLVTPQRLRFDFSHPQPLTQEQLCRIERLVNDKILENAATETRVMPLAQALQAGAMSLFGEKYADEVRVLRIAGDFSVELCGGTHVQRAGDIGLFKLLTETGIAAGVRRIEALSGHGALAWVETQEAQLATVSELLKCGREQFVAKLEQTLERHKQLEKELRQAQAKLAAQAGDNLSAQAERLCGIQVLAHQLDGADAKALRETVDRLKDKLGSAIIVLGAAQGDKVSLVAGVTQDNTARFKAGELINYVAQQVGGKGGGRADLAQAGGNDPRALAAALASVRQWVLDKAPDEAAGAGT